MRPYSYSFHHAMNHLTPLGTGRRDESRHSLSGLIAPLFRRWR